MRHSRLFPPFPTTRAQRLMQEALYYYQLGYRRWSHQLYLEALAHYEEQKWRLASLALSTISFAAIILGIALVFLLFHH